MIIDDVLVDRVIVNWIDTPHDDHFEVQIEYPNLYFLPKSELVFVKSSSGWCFPTTQYLIQDESGYKLIQKFIELWNSIRTEDDYYKVLPNLPIQNFVYFSKIKDRGYTFIDLGY